MADLNANSEVLQTIFECNTKYKKSPRINQYRLARSSILIQVILCVLLKVKTYLICYYQQVQDIDTQTVTTNSVPDLRPQNFSSVS